MKHSAPSRNQLHKSMLRRYRSRPYHMRYLPVPSPAAAFSYTNPAQTQKQHTPDQEMMNITFEKTGEVHRVSRALAINMFLKGFTHTTKCKYKAFIKKVAKLDPATKKDLYSEYMLQL